MSDSNSSTTRTGAGVLGTGHPNKYLQADFADIIGGTPQWVVRLETLIPIDDGMRDTLQKELGSTSVSVKRSTAAYLIGKVPVGKDPEAAKRMVAAAFGFDYPLDRPTQTADIGKTAGAKGGGRAAGGDEVTGR